MTSHNQWKIQGSLGVLDATDRDPSRADRSGENLEKRVVIICPYPTFGAMFGEFLLQLNPDIDIDEINDSSLPNNPYIDVIEREAEKPLPTYIIDFMSINHGDKIVPFAGYANWVAENYNAGITDHLYFITRGMLDQAIDIQRTYEGKKWNRHSADFEPFRETLKADARILLGGDLQNLTLLHNWIGGIEDLTGKRHSDFKMPEEED